MYSRAPLPAISFSSPQGAGHFVPNLGACRVFTTPPRRADAGTCGGSSIGQSAAESQTYLQFATAFDSGSRVRATTLSAEASGSSPARRYLSSSSHAGGVRRRPLATNAGRRAPFRWDIRIPNRRPAIRIQVESVCCRRDLRKGPPFLSGAGGSFDFPSPTGRSRGTTEPRRVTSESKRRGGVFGD